MAELDVVLRAGKYIYWNDRPKHSGFITGMPYRSLMYGIDHGILFYAIPNEETNGD